jgi:hypothetical protein
MLDLELRFEELIQGRSLEQYEATVKRLSSEIEELE